jgi:hypothetical protein
VARHHGVEAFVNMSQMTVSQMSISETTDSPQHKLHWLAEQALSWSGLPIVTVRPTVFLEGFFLQFAAPGVRASDELALPLGGGKTSPISAVDVAHAVAVILDNPAPHIGQIYDLTGPESADLDHYARVFSEALGRPIRYRDAPLPAWSEGLRQAKSPEHLVRHLTAMAELTKQGRYDRMTDAMYKLTGEAPSNMRDFVKLHAAWTGAFLKRCRPAKTAAGGQQRCDVGRRLPQAVRWWAKLAGAIAHRRGSVGRFMNLRSVTTPAVHEALSASARRSCRKS